MTSASPVLAHSSLLRPGDTCWRLTTATRAACLVDASAYYEAFAEAAEKAERSILIAGWDIDGRVRLRRSHPAENLLTFLLRLLDRKPQLEVHILTWDFIWIYADDREVLPIFDRRWRQHPRLHLHWDAHHPRLSCHHQKVVVIDDEVAFSGGLDFTDERWDTPDHLPVDRRRKPLRRDVYKPFHDLMMMVEGPAARRLGDLVRERWRRAVGRTHAGNGVPRALPVPAVPTGSKWPASVRAEFSQVPLGIARTEPEFDGYPPVYEIERQFVAMIQSARDFIYIENQYFTATRIIAALAKRLRRPDAPEVVVVLPHGCTGWIETFVLGVSRWRIIRRLREADGYGRLHIYYPDVAGLLPEHYIKVHAKLMIVDDEWLRIGSANLCNRSMVVDTECDVTLDGRSGPESKSAIRDVRLRLLSEHTATPAAQLSAWLDETGSMSKTIARCDHPFRRLVPFSGEVWPILDRMTPRWALDGRRRLIQHARTQSR